METIHKYPRIYAFIGIGLIALILLLGLVFSFFIQKDNVAFAGISNQARDVLGSRVATTTTGGGFYGLPSANGTTSAVAFVGGEIDEATLAFKITNASSTPNGRLTWALFGSNDYSCDTATTTTSLSNTVVTDDINWFTIDSGDSITATGAVATGTKESFTGLDWDCLRVETNGSSTEAWVQLRTKTSDF